MLHEQRDFKWFTCLLKGAPGHAEMKPLPGVRSRTKVLQQSGG